MNSSKTSLNNLTVIMPVYNERDCIREIVAEVRERILGPISGSQLLVVDDGSTDGSSDILNELAENDPAICVIHKKNGGHGAALLTGLRSAGGEYLFLMDSDGQIPLGGFAEFWRLRSPGVFLCGVRQKREDPAHRRILTRIVATGVWAIFGRRLHDCNAPFKLFYSDFWLRASALIPDETLAPSLFLAVIASRDPAIRLVEAPVGHLPRRAGQSTLRPWRLLRFCTKAFLQLTALRRTLRRR